MKRKCFALTVAIALYFFSAVAQKTDTLMENVTVRGHKPLFEQKIDRLVVNVNASITNAGSNALEVLQKTPGVLVNDNGSIILKGRSGVLVFVDDKQIFLTGNDLINYLRSLPAEMLDVVELMSNPPAKYDAAGSGGVINIRLKKSRIKGFNGNVSASYSHAYYPRPNGSFNINFRRNKLNFFSSLGISRIHNHRILEIHRKIFENDHTQRSAFDQSTLILIKAMAYNMRSGFDYFLSPRTTIGFVHQGSIVNQKDLRQLMGSVYGSTPSIDSIIQAENTASPRMHFNSYNLNYSHQYRQTGRSISSDLVLINFNSNNHVQFTNNILDPAGNPKSSDKLKGDLPVHIRIYTAQIDYTQPLKNKGRLELGAKTTHTNTNNRALYDNWQNNQWVPDYDRTNHFQYKEYIGAAYINFNKETKRITIQTGLRFEKTWLKGHQLGNIVKPDSSFKQQYAGLFPTAYLSYRLDSTDNRILISYGRRIFRPFYQDLNPFLIPLDKFTYFAGNPALKPQYTNRYELSWLYKNLLNTTILYSVSKNVQQETAEQKNSIFISRNANIGRQVTKGITTNLNWRTSKWLSSNVYVQVINNHFKGILYGQLLDNQATYWSMNVVNSFTFNKGWGAELSGFYTSRNISGQYILLPWWQLHAGVQKRLLKNKATVRFNVRDIFKSMRIGGDITSIANASASFLNHFDSRSFTLTFNWNFGKNTNIPERRQTRDTGSEEGRVRKN